MSRMRWRSTSARGEAVRIESAERRKEQALRIFPTRTDLDLQKLKLRNVVVEWV